MIHWRGIGHRVHHEEATARTSENDNVCDPLVDTSTLAPYPGLEEGPYPSNNTSVLVAA